MTNSIRSAKDGPLHAVLVMNLKSRQTVSYKDLIIKLLQEKGIVLDRIYRIRKGKRLHSTLKGIVKDKPNLIIIAAGDGTVSDAVDYIANTEIEMAILPLGTTNNFARSLGVPLDLEAAILNIRNKTAKRVDLGCVNGDLFSNIAGVGISAEIASAVTDDLKKRYGRLAYAITGLRLLIHHKSFHATISSASSNLKLNFKTHQLIIANGKYHAGKEIAADAKADSRELVVFKLGGTTRISLLWHFLDFYLGKRMSVNHTAYLLAKNINLKTDRTVRIELDGETKEITPANIFIKPSVILIRH